MLTFKKILCPTDFSEASYQGLAKAVELASIGETEICVVYVDKPLPQTEGEAVRRAEAVRNLSDVLSERVPDSVRWHPLLKTGDAAGEIVQAAKAEGADLIILTTHGAGGWQSGVLGSVAQEVLRLAPCPVLVISGPASGKIDSSHLEELLRERTGAMKPEIEVIRNHALHLTGD